MTWRQIARRRLARFISRGIQQNPSSPEVVMSERPLSRQPSCRYCDHEHHEFTRCHADLGDLGPLCPCPPSRPVGVYS